MRIDREITPVRLQNSSLDERDGRIVAHGWLDIAALQLLRVGDYQREIVEVHHSRKSKILTAIENGDRLPDIILGMRGDGYSARGAIMNLENDVFIIDGLQRVSQLRKFASENPDRAQEVRVGAEVRFNTTREIEKDFFTKLNLNRLPMSPNVILRNARENSNGLLTIYGLTHNDPSFALYGRVCWNQTMNRNEIISANILCRTSAQLHGSGATPKMSLLPGMLEKKAKEVGLQTFRDNIYRFFEVMDEVWGIKGIKYVDMTTHLRSGFLTALSNMIYNHDNFWDGNKLVVEANMRNKLKTFPLNDPNVQQMARTSSGMNGMLYRLLIDHMNKGNRVNRLVERIIIINKRGNKVVKPKAA